MLLAGVALAANLPSATHRIVIGNEAYQVELATTPEERGRGLMYREHLDPRGGMLLVYRSPGNHRIWMKNVPIPLWVYWIDGNSEVIGARRLEPCTSDPCPVYAVDRPSLYVLELADGDHRLLPGNRIRGLDSLPP
ncbi:MAG TPA: DUF192 domain-containing protein [Gammaproteobacteria bacterium]|nr:DUF192 domain-containing protein [Gammaproteobacteria bacterium]